LGIGRSGRRVGEQRRGAETQPGRELLPSARPGLAAASLAAAAGDGLFLLGTQA